MRELRLLLDEHYPPWLAAGLVADGLDVLTLTQDRPHLRGADDTTVLRAAAAERRIVVTEDVSNFGAAIAAVPDHVGVIYCLATRYPRTRSGLAHLHRALITLAGAPPYGLGEAPLVLWL